jgi:RNA polymerase sigma factor (sigma-70 family)
LVVATEAGDKAAARELIEAFLPAIASIVRRFDVGGAVQHAELMQEGVTGLLFAARRYDARTRTPFWAYASFWVRKALQELVADVGRPVALSDHAVRGLARIRAARREHVGAHGREPTTAELVAATGFAEAQLDSLLATERAPLSFQEPATMDGHGDALSETLADPSAEVEYDQVLERLMIHQLDLVHLLDERERAVLAGHYGIGQPPETLAHIGAQLGFTAERARQNEKGALDKLRDVAANPGRDERA